MMPSVALLASRGCVRVSGPAARDFLQGLLTQDVTTLAPGELRFGALLSPPGRLLFDLFLLGLDDGVLLDVAADRREALVKRLGLYKLRSQVEIQVDDRPVYALWGGPSEALARDPRRGELGHRAYGPEPAATTTEAAYDHWCLGRGVPGPADWPDDSTYPIEANFDLLNGIDFAKGCFVGQETTSRMKRRGTVKSRMLPLRVASQVTAGAEVMNGTLRAGVITHQAGDLAMALMRLDRMAGNLTVEGRAVTARPPVWIPLPSASE